MQEQRYRIEELEEASGVSIRNIRYYTAEGLLPPPDARGRFALYSDDHVRRLRLIQRLKEEFLPLEIIRAKLQELSDPQVAEALTERSEAPLAPGPAAPGSAASYIANVMAKRRRTAASPAEAVPPPPMASPAPALAEAPAPALAEAPAPGDDLPAAEDWRRIPLAAGVELHVRHVDDRVRQLIAFARTLFRSGS